MIKKFGLNINKFVELVKNAVNNEKIISVDITDEDGSNANILVNMTEEPSMEFNQTSLNMTKNAQAQFADNNLGFSYLRTASRHVIGASDNNNKSDDIENAENPVSDEVSSGEPAEGGGEVKGVKDGQKETDLAIDGNFDFDGDGE